MGRVAVSKITSKGQVTIPEEIRREYRLQAGDQVQWEITDRGTIELRKAGGSLEDLARVLPRPSRTATVEDMDAAVRSQGSREHRARR